MSFILILLAIILLYYLAKFCLYFLLPFIFSTKLEKKAKDFYKKEKFDKSNKRIIKSDKIGEVTDYEEVE